MISEYLTAFSSMPGLLCLILTTPAIAREDTSQELQMAKLIAEQIDAIWNTQPEVGTANIMIRISKDE